MSIDIQPDEEERYSLPTIVLHWAHAALVIALLTLGWYLADLPKGPDRSAAISLHKSLGLCALILIVLRLGWRWLGPIVGRKHPPPPTASALQGKIASWTHRLLYVALVIAPLAGLLSASFTRYTMKFFGIELPRLFAADEGINLIFNSLHKLSTTALTALIGLHLAGTALHLLRREKVLQRMLPPV